MKKLYIVIIGLVICAIGIVVFFKFKNNSLDETLKEAKSMSSYQFAFSRIKQLEQNGYIRRIPASPRAIKIL